MKHVIETTSCKLRGDMEEIVRDIEGSGYIGQNTQSYVER